MLALCVLQNPAVNVSQDLGGPKTLVLMRSQDLACPTAAVRVEQDSCLVLHKEWLLPCFTHWRAGKFTDGVSALAFSSNKTNFEFKSLKEDLPP